MTDHDHKPIDEAALKLGDICHLLADIVDQRPDWPIDTILSKIEGHLLMLSALTSEQRSELCLRAMRHIAEGYFSGLASLGSEIPEREASDLN